MASSQHLDLIGVIHLPALPGAPGARLSVEQVIDRAAGDAQALLNGGIRMCIVENFGDAPFRRGRVNPHVPACMAVIATAIRERVGDELTLGINVLRNDALSALGAAAACNAAFVRVNVLNGSAWTDQGLIQGEADAVLRYRRSLGVDVKIMADVCVKHAVPAGEDAVGRLASDALERGGADGIIVTGMGTGMETAVDDLRSARAAVPTARIWVGSGVTPDTVRAYRQLADGVIVGTHLHKESAIGAPIDEDRVRAMVAAARS